MECEVLCRTAGAVIVLAVLLVSVARPQVTLILSGVLGVLVWGSESHVLWPLLFLTPGLGCSSSLSSSSGPPPGHVGPSGSFACYTQTFGSHPLPPVHGPSPLALSIHVMLVWHEAVRRVLARGSQPSAGHAGEGARPDFPSLPMGMFSWFIPCYVHFRSFDFSVSLRALSQR